LAVALAVAACRQRKRVRFITAAELVTEMIGIRQSNRIC
jgi:DNA replication protein DnaC